MEIKIVLEHGGIMPTKATGSAAAYDLYLPTNTVVHPGRQVIPLAFRIQVPVNHKACIDPRSGFSCKGMEGYDLYIQADNGETYYYTEHSKWLGMYSWWEGESARYDADVIHGTIDPDYTGIVGVIINSHEPKDFVLPIHTRIAQMTIEPVNVANWNEVKKLDETQRGDGGFGSTGCVKITAMKDEEEQ